MSTRRSKCFGFAMFHTPKRAARVLDACCQGKVTMQDRQGKTWYLKAEYAKDEMQLQGPRGMDADGTEGDLVAADDAQGKLEMNVAMLQHEQQQQQEEEQQQQQSCEFTGAQVPPPVHRLTRNLHHQPPS